MDCATTTTGVWGLQGYAGTPSAPRANRPRLRIDGTGSTSSERVGFLREGGSAGAEKVIYAFLTWSPMMKVKSPMPGACAPEFTVGFPKPLSASHVAASMRSLVLAPFSPRNTLSVGEKSFSELV